MKNFINFLPPWVETNIQPAFYDKESGSVLQQTARMYAKVNQLVRHFNCLAKETKETVEEYIAKFVELKDFVDTYFENLDVQEEINNKLDEMAEDGTLANIIDEYLYNLATRSQESAIALSFYIEGGNLTNFINYTNDGVNWKQVKLDNFTGRDPSLVYDKNRKCFYLTVTPASNQTHSFKIYKTTDFVTFEEKSLLIGTYYAEDIMAPDLYLDEINDKLIVNFSYKTGNTVIDCDGQTIPEYWLYRVDLTLDDDIANITPVTTPQALVLTGAESTCMIDSNIIYHNNLYYMNCKDDINKIVQVYQSADGINYNLICPNVLNNTNDADNTLYIEGGSWFKFNNEFYLICDSYYNLHKLIVGKTQNFVNFYDWSETNMNRMRHAGVISVDSDELKVQMLTLPNFGYNTNDKLPYYGKPSDISRQFADGFEGQIIAVPNMLYTFLGDAHITDILNPFHCESIDFMFAGQPNKTITIDKIQHITKNKVLHNSFENNEKLFTILMSSSVNSYPTDDYQNYTEYDKDFIEDYFTVGTGWSYVDGYAYRQGNIMSLMVTIRPDAVTSGSGALLLQKKPDVQGVFIPKKKVIMSNEAPSVMSSVTLFPVSGNITANLTSAPVRDYTIFATYIVN